jgi:hypothetical protein
MRRGTIYALDLFPPQPVDQDGIGLGVTFDGEAVVAWRSSTVSVVAVSAWRGHGSPSNSACVRSLATSGAAFVQFGPPGITMGGWMCCRTMIGYVARLRLDGGDTNSGYRFHVTVWDH